MRHVALVLTLIACSDTRDQEIAALKQRLAEVEKTASLTAVRSKAEPSLTSKLETVPHGNTNQVFGVDLKAQLDRIDQLKADDTKAAIALKEYSDKALIGTLGMVCVLCFDRPVLTIAESAREKAPYDQQIKGGSEYAGKPIVISGTISEIDEPNHITVATINAGMHEIGYTGHWHTYTVVGRFTTNHSKWRNVEVIGYTALSHDGDKNPAIAAIAMLKPGGLSALRKQYGIAQDNPKQAGHRLIKIPVADGGDIAAAVKKAIGAVRSEITMGHEGKTLIVEVHTATPDRVKKFIQGNYAKEASKAGVKALEVWGDGTTVMGSFKVPDKDN